MKMRTVVLLAAAGAAAAVLPTSKIGSSLTRAAFMRTACTTLATSAFSGAAVSNAFDVPPLDQFDDPRQRTAFAANANPGLTKQASSAFYAVTVGDVGSLKAMLDAGWDLNSATDSAGKTTLHRAAQVGNEVAVKMLLDAGVKVDPITRWSETPLHFAVRNGRLGAVKQLVAAGASLSKETFGGDNALQVARKYRMTSIVDFLSPAVAQS